MTTRAAYALRTPAPMPTNLPPFTHSLHLNQHPTGNDSPPICPAGAVPLHHQCIRAGRITRAHGGSQHHGHLPRLSWGGHTHTSGHAGQRHVSHAQLPGKHAQAAALAGAAHSSVCQCLCDRHQDSDTRAAATHGELAAAAIVHVMVYACGGTLASRADAAGLCNCNNRMLRLARPGTS